MRLIDADALNKKLCKTTIFIKDGEVFQSMINDAPTIEQPTGDLISRQAAIRWVKTECNPYGKPTLDFESGKRVMEHLAQMPSAEPKTRCIAQITIDRDDMEDLVNEKVNEIVDKMSEPKTDGVFVKGGLTIGGEPPMPEGCMDCKLQDRCLCIPPNLSADEISELYISRRPNCPLSMVEEPKIGTWVHNDKIGTFKIFTCDKCGCNMDTDAWDFCPNCGARMYKGGEDE